MASYQVPHRREDPDWDPRRRTYKYLGPNTAEACAQDEFDERARAGLYARIVEWSHYKGAGHEQPRVIQTTDENAATTR